MTITKEDLDQGIDTGLGSLLTEYADSDDYEDAFLQAIGGLDNEIQSVLSKNIEQQKLLYEEVENSNSSGNNIVEDILKGGMLGYAEEIAKSNKDFAIDLIKEIREVTVQGFTIEEAVIEFFEGQPIKAYYEKTTGVLVYSETVLSETTHIPVGKVLGQAIEGLGVLALVEGFKDTAIEAYEAAINPGDIAETAEALSSYMKTGGATLLGLWVEKALGGGLFGGGVGAGVTGLILGASGFIEDAIGQTILAAYNASKTASEMWDDISDVVGNKLNDLMNEAGQQAHDLFDGAEDKVNDFHDGLNDLMDDYGWAWNNPGAVLGEIFPDWFDPTKAPFDVAPQQESPLVIDLDGDGVELTALDTATNPLFFDIDNDGFAEATGWVASDDGLLAIDIDENGSIDNAGELFGSSDVDGFAILAAYDTNDDLVINALDDDFSDLLIWRDLNQNGISEADELKSLSFYNIESIDLGGITASDDVIAGNTISHTSTFAYSDGTLGNVVDAWFSVDQALSYTVQDYTLDVRTLFMPTLRGFGELEDLHIAMSRDNGTGGLLEMVQDFTVSVTLADFSDEAALRTEIESILFKWAETVPEGTYLEDAFTWNGEVYDVFAWAEHVQFIEKLFGESGRQTPWDILDNSSRTLGGSSRAMQESFDLAYNQLSAQLLIQTVGQTLFENGVSYNPFTAEIEGDTTLSQTAINSLTSFATATGVDAESYWVAVAKFLDTVKGYENFSTNENSWMQTAIVASDISLSWTDIKDLTEVEYQPSTYLADPSDTTLIGTMGDNSLYGTGDQLIIDGKEGNDYILSGHSSDYASTILIGGEGDDRIEGTYGDETYVYTSGDDYYTDYNGIDVIEFPENIELSDLSFYVRNNTNLFISVGDLGSIEINRFFQYDQYIVETLFFHDSSALDLSSLNEVKNYGDNSSQPLSSVAIYGNYLKTELYGNGGDDVLYGGDNDDFFHGGAGNDLIITGGGDDTIMFSAGFDVLTADTGFDTLVIPEAYGVEDVTILNVIQENGIYFHDFVIQVDGLGQLRVDDQVPSGDTYLLDQIIFENGDPAINLLTYDVLTVGTNGDDVFQKSSSNSYYKDDIYLFGKGNDLVWSDYEGTDTVLFQAGISFSDLIIYREFTYVGNDSDLVIVDLDGNTLRFDNHFVELYGFDWRLEKLEFHDGTIINVSDYEYDTIGTEAGETIHGAEIGDASTADTIFAYGGNDNISGYSGNDIIYAGAGDDYVYGGDGDDSIYGGFGADDIYGDDGADTFIFELESAFYDVDIIRDFDPSEGDVLDLSGLLNGYFQSSTDDIDDFVQISGTGSTRTLSVDQDGGADNFVQITTLQNVSELASVQSLYDNGYIYTTNISNLVPVAATDVFAADEDDVITGNLLTNNGNGVDSDPDTDTLSVLAVTITSINGATVIISIDGSFSYTPVENYNGSDSFQYLLLDDQGAGAFGQVNLTLSAVNDDPIAGDDLFYGLVDTNITGNLLSNNGNGADYDVENGTLSVQDGTFTTAGGGTIIIQSNGSFSYTPLSSYTGDDTFDYTLFDGQGGSGTGTITLSVNDEIYTILDGTSSGEYLYGSSDADYISGLEGNDYLYGYQGNDVYFWNVGDGSDIIYDDTGFDKLEFGNEIVAGDLRLWNDNSGNLQVYIGSEYITINDHFDSTGEEVEIVLFSDSSTLDLVNNLTFTGTSSGEYVYGFNDDNILIGGEGSDYIYDTGGDDTYVWNLGDGSDYIYDTGAGTADKIEFGAGIVSTDVRLWNDGSGNLLIYIGSDFIQINDHFDGTGEEIESIVFANSTSIDLTQNLTFTGTEYSEYIYGTSSSDTFAGREGSDYIYGYGGDDTYVWNLGDGSDYIYDTGGSADKIRIGNNITESNIRLWNNGSGDLEVHIGESYITINNHFDGTGEDIESIVFDNATSIDLTQDLTFKGTSSSDYMYGTGNADTLYGMAGNDYIYGYGGNDTYVWNTGDGSNYIYDSAGSADAIELGSGITANDVRLWNDGSGNLQVYIGSDFIQVNDQFDGTGGEVETLLFNDTSTISLVNNLTFKGTSYGDYMYGTGNADTLYGMEGGDTIYGYGGNDTYVWNTGDGSDYIYDSAGSADSIELGSGITANDVRLWNDGSGNLQVYIGSDFIQVNDQFDGTGGEVETLLFNDTSTISLVNNLIFKGTSYGDYMYGTGNADTLYGLDSGDTIYGYGGDDVLYGGDGYDSLYGGAGADTFVFLSGETGTDTIGDFSTGDDDVLDISDLLTGYDPMTDLLTDFVQITDDGSHSYLAIDADGGADNFVQIAILNNVTGLTDEDALITSGNLVVV